MAEAGIRRFLSRINRGLLTIGVDSRQVMQSVRGIPAIRTELREYERQREASKAPDEFPITRFYPIYGDRFEAAGKVSGHYFHQDLLVAREIFHRRPNRHVDVGSSISGFVSHVAAFRDIEVFDIRPTPSSVQGITFVQQNILRLDEGFHEYSDSVSCLHALEHFGLGRYTDPVDYEGWRKGLVALSRILQAKGTLYLGVPTGEFQRVEFNAHRVFSLPFLRRELERDFLIERLAFVDDSGGLTPNVDPYGRDAEKSFGAHYGCSIWILSKR